MPVTFAVKYGSARFLPRVSSCACAWRAADGGAQIWAGQVLEAAHLKPILRSVTSHTGKDHFTPAERDNMLSFAVSFAGEHAVRVYHETHRGRILYRHVNTPGEERSGAGRPARMRT